MRPKCQRKGKQPAVETVLLIDEQDDPLVD